ncbi:MAG: DUF481 domain-containing protein [Deltaproteobacteria bacterium]|nr:DUF481 domain-containing protein [Deltaproteobacteria bacterium]
MPHSRHYAGQRAVLSLTMAAAIAATAATAAHGQDLDRVILRNGNPVVGEIEELRRGKLSVDTDEMDVVRVDWDDIAFVTSSRIFEVTDTDGTRYFGSLEQTTEEATLVVAQTATADTVAFGRIVELTLIGRGFLARTKGFVDVGGNFFRANDLASILLAGRLAYTGPIWEFDYNGDAYFQRQETTTDTGEVFEEQTKRLSASVGVKRFFRKSWAATSSAEIEQNEELSLDSRILLTLGGHYQIIRNQGWELAALAGGAFNSEAFTGEERTSSGEILLAAGFDAFDVGDLDLYTTVTSFTAPDGKRFRVNVDARVSWEIFNDFSVGFNAKEAYDSAPPTEDAGRDYQYGLTIGWSWS